MNRKSLAALLAAALCAGAAVAAQPVYVCFGTDGSMTMGSAPNGENCQRVDAVAEPAAAAAPAATPAQPVREAQSAPPSRRSVEDAAPARQPAEEASGGASPELPPMEARLAKYRGSMLQGASGGDGAPVSAINPAVNRRYRMTSRSAFQSGR